MCGIVAIYNKEIKLDKDMRSKSLSMSKKVRHRGPDWSGIYTSDNAILAHGGELFLEDSPLGGLRVRIILPLKN